MLLTQTKARTPFEGASYSYYKEAASIGFFALTLGSFPQGHVGTYPPLEQTRGAFNKQPSTSRTYQATHNSSVSLSESDIEGALAAFESLTATIKRHIEQGRVSQARSLLESIHPLDSLSLREWREILRQPEITIGKAGGGTMKDIVDWLRNNADKLNDTWVALSSNGELLGHDQSHKRLVERLKSAGTSKGAVFVRLS